VTSYRHEDDLFVQLKETCARTDTVRYSDLLALPSILADILLRKPPITRVSEILPRAMEIRLHGGGSMRELFDHCPPGRIRQSRNQSIHYHMVVGFGRMSIAILAIPVFCSLIGGCAS
jgi:hypothetical protein